jgi:hypothetical protein
MPRSTEGAEIEFIEPPAPGLVVLRHRLCPFRPFPPHHRQASLNIGGRPRVFTSCFGLAFATV